MNRRSQRQMKLIDSYQHGADCELYIVEGESAASSVSAICNRNFQAVLPLQGKPLNAYKTTADKVETSPLHYQFAKALGLAKSTNITPQEMTNLNFGKVFLLFDPDADGIHIGALVMMYIQRWLPELITQGKVYMLRVPMFSIHSRSDGHDDSKNEKIEFAYLPQQLAQIKQRITDENNILVKTERYQSVGSVPPALLETLCIKPNTRQTTVVTMEMVNMNIEVFG